MKQKHKKFSQGFTLIEVLLVISILTLMASILFSAFKNARTQTFAVKSQTDMQQVAKALELYYDDNGSYPTTDYISQFPSSSPSSWEKLGELLKPYIQTFPRPPGSGSYYWYVSSWFSTGGKCFLGHKVGQSFGLYAWGNTNSFAAEDGGINSNAFEVYRGDFEIGPYSQDPPLYQQHCGPYTN